MLKDLFNNKGQSNHFSKDLKNLLGYSPGRVELYVLAFTHSSVVDKDVTKESNERLEFLGDAILDSIVAEYLFKKYPYKDEGFLTEIRSRIVKRETLNDIAVKIGIKGLLHYNKSIHQKSIYGNAFEALVGAIYLDKGYEKTVKFIHNKILDTQVDIEHLIQQNDNFKSILLEWGSKNKKEIEFEIVEASKTKTNTNFKAIVKDGSKVIGEGVGKNKKSSEQAAAEQACGKLKLL